MILHPDRYSTGAPTRKYGVCVHDSESGDDSFRALISVLGSPGDRDNGHGGVYGSGYTAVTDGLGGFTVVADANVGPYAAPPLNPTWAHVCMPGRAAQTREEWLDPLSRNHIRGVAKFIVAQWHADGHSWPLEFVHAAELVAGKHGYTAHAQVSLAWHKTDHTDPGPNFPWDVLASDIAALVDGAPTPTPLPEDDMNMGIIHAKDDGAYHAQFMGWYREPGIFFDLKWIRTPGQIATRDRHIAAGAKVFDAISQNDLKGCAVDVVPTGDKVDWSGIFAWPAG